MLQFFPFLLQLPIDHFGFGTIYREDRKKKQNNQFYFWLLHETRFGHNFYGQFHLFMTMRFPIHTHTHFIHLLVRLISSERVHAHTHTHKHTHISCFELACANIHSKYERTLTEPPSFLISLFINNINQWKHSLISLCALYVMLMREKYA